MTQPSSSFSEAVAELTALYAESDRHYRVYRANCTCGSEISPTCPWYAAWLASMDPVAEAHGRLGAAFSSGDYHAILDIAQERAYELHAAA